MKILQKTAIMLFTIAIIFTTSVYCISDTAKTELEKALEMKHTLRFGEDGEFKVIMFSDIHDDCINAPRAIEAIIADESPDLVLFGGDTTMGSTEDEVRLVLDAVTEPMESRGIPWAHVYGNHDAEYGLTRGELQEIYSTYEYCVSKTVDGIYGVSNYVLPVLASDSDEIKFAVWGLDSNNLLDEITEGLGHKVTLDNTMPVEYEYDYIHFDQVSWYYNTSVALEELCGKKVPSMMYFHIPIPQFKKIALNPDKTDMVGTYQETVWDSYIDSGIFSAALERKDVLGIFCGHVHKNDFVGRYCDIMMGFVSTVSSEAYHNPAILGARVFTVNESEPDKLDTRMVYLSDEKYADIYDGSEYIEPVDEPSLVNAVTLLNLTGFTGKSGKY